jgi:hypothetical protein
MNRSGRPWPALILASCLAAGLSTWLDATQPARTISVLWFFLICPGLALVGMLGIRDLLAEIVVAIALSVSLGTGVALVMALADVWSPDVGLAILIAVSILGAVLQIGGKRFRGEMTLSRDGGTLPSP